MATIESIACDLSGVAFVVEFYIWVVTHKATHGQNEDGWELSCQI